MSEQSLDSRKEELSKKYGIDFEKLEREQIEVAKQLVVEDKIDFSLVENFGAVDNILEKGKKLIVLDYKTRGYPLKEDTHEHYQAQMDIYNFLLRRNGFDTEDYAYLLFYYPKEVTNTGEVIFDTTLKKMKVDVKMAEKVWKKALNLLDEDCPEKCCEWCEGK